MNASLRVFDAMGRMIHEGPTFGALGASWPAGVYRIAFNAPYFVEAITVLKQ